MKNRENNRIFILLPSKSSSGPIKGAYAMANGLLDRYQVSIIYFRKGKGVNSYLDPRVNEIFLKKNKYLFLSKLIEYRKLLKDFKVNISLSMCFSADLINFFCKDITYIFSSVRGNLPANYYLDYGFLGLLLAYLHLNLMRNFDKVLSMSKVMQKQIKKISNVDSEILFNFIDEKSLEVYRSKKKLNSNEFNIVFLGTLSSRKQPILLLDIFNEIAKENCFLNLIGDGPLYKKIKSKISKYDLNKKVIMHGFLKSPYSILAKSDLLIIPSRSEGTSRAILEGLFLGVKCIVLDVDANTELSSKSSNIFAVKTKEELKNKLLLCIENSKSNNLKENFLPKDYSQKKCINKLINILKSYDSKYYDYALD